VSNNKIIVRYKDNKNSDKQKVSLYSELLDKKFEWSDDSTCIILVDPKEKDDLLNKVINQQDVKTCNPVYNLNTGFEMGVTDEFVVKYVKNADKDQIGKFIDQHKLKIAKISESFVLFKVPDKGDALEIANKFQETGLTIFSHPNFISKIETFQIPNDPYFANQFYLNNTGQVFTDNHYGYYDADIDAPEAWQTTKGLNNIIVAVLDEGVTSDHSDLPNSRQMRLNGSNFGDGDSNNPSPTGDMNHGNSCAGVIGATQNNYEGISGIAPNSIILPIRIFNSNRTGIPPANVAAAIDFARTSGAHIISNSWGYGPGATDPNLFPVIVTAISDAVTLGRNGLGCVVVFAASNSANHANNENGEIRFPANVNISGVLTVGASSRYDLQANYSPTSNNSSQQNQIIDLVAPSHKAYSNQISGETYEVWSIDIPGNPGYNNVKETDGGALPTIGSVLPNTGTNFLSYTGRFGGTSAACPQVAAVASLILSILPNLTQQQVFNIITSQADKIGGYSYSGGWCNELGYGRLNANRAVTQALSLSGISMTQNFLVCTSGTTYSVSNVPPGFSVEWSTGSYVQRSSPQYSNPCSFYSTGNGYSSIQAKLISTNGSITLPSLSVWSGRFNSTSVTGQAAVCPGQLYTYTAQVPGGHSPSYSYAWTYPANWYFYSQYDNVIRLQTPMYNPQYGAVRVSITNCSGASDYSGMTVYPGYCGRGYTIYPNPASDNITIEIDNSTKYYDLNTENLKEANDPTLERFTVRIYDKQGILISSIIKSGIKFEVPVNNLRDGIYIIEISDSKFKYSEQLIIKH
jgi:subtilisin family serine protease